MGTVFGNFVGGVVPNVMCIVISFVIEVCTQSLEQVVLVLRNIFWKRVGG